jgi:hypothetical protein
MSCIGIVAESNTDNLSFPKQAKFIRKRFILVITGSLFFCLYLIAKAHGFKTGNHGYKTVSIDKSDYMDKLMGGWAGQMAGVTWGASTEFRYQGRIMPADKVPQWSPGLINDAFNQDDIYVEVPFLDAMKIHGFQCSWSVFGDYFRDTGFDLWHANKAGRDNLRSGILAPESGHYSRNPHSDDIDWQIEADFVGMICPGQPMSAADIAWRAGHVMNYGDGVYGGVFVTAMHSAAFTASTLDEVIEAGRNALPAGGKYREMIEDVIRWKNAGMPWEQTWLELESKWGRDDRCPDGKENPFNIDAKMNGAYVLVGLLYGGGDFEESMRIAMRCGQDSDCNPSSVGGILGNWLGWSRIPGSWKSALDRNARKFSNTDYTFDGLTALCSDLARKILTFNSGTAGETVWTFPEQESLPLILEQWPDSSNAIPDLLAQTVSVDDKTVRFHASASDADGILAYQWHFGDLSFAGGADVTHTYRQFGLNEVICFVTDRIGNTAYRSWLIEVNDPSLPVIRLKAVDSTVSEGGAVPGRFRFFREGYLDRDFTVHFTIEGTAENGTDYQAVPDSLVIRANQSSADLAVVPVDDRQYGSAKTIRIMLVPDVRYNIGVEYSGEMTLIDNDARPGPVAFWSFDEVRGDRILDTSGNGHHGTTSNAVPAQGVAGDGLSFSGADQSFVRVADAGDLEFGASDSFTLSAWINVRSLPGHWSGIVTKSRDQGDWYGIWIDDENRWVFGTNQNFTGPEVTLGWHHVAAVQDGIRYLQRLVVDGMEIARSTVTACDGTGDLYIGKAGIQGESFDGIVDEIGIYRYALSQSEILRLMNDPSFDDRKDTTGAQILAVRLHQNFPNPFNSNTSIRCDLPEKASVDLVLFNMRGEIAATLLNGVQESGMCSVTWDGRDREGRELPNGIYLCRMNAGKFSKTIKLLLIR